MRYTRLKTVAMLLITAGCATTPNIPTATDDRLTMTKFNALQKGMSVAECNRIIGRSGVAREPDFARDDFGRAVVEGDSYIWGEFGGPFICCLFIDGHLRDKTHADLP